MDRQHRPPLLRPGEAPLLPTWPGEAPSTASSRGHSQHLALVPTQASRGKGSVRAALPSLASTESQTWQRVGRVEDRRLLSEPPLPPGSGHPHNQDPPGQVAIAPHLRDLRNPPPWVLPSSRNGPRDPVTPFSKAFKGFPLCPDPNSQHNTNHHGPEPPGPQPGGLSPQLTSSSSGLASVPPERHIPILSQALFTSCSGLPRTFLPESLTGLLLSGLQVMASKSGLSPAPPPPLQQSTQHSLLKESFLFVHRLSQFVTMCASVCVLTFM